MEHPSRLNYLPPELRGELIYRQDWRDIRDNLELPEYARFKDPNHPVWRELYRQRLSSYPLPNGTDYRQQFFWGSAKADDPNIEFDVLAELGYDVVIQKRDLRTAEPGDLGRAFRTAAMLGYLNIVKYLLKNAPEAKEYTPNAIYSAIKFDRLDVVSYLLPRIDQRDYFDLLDTAVIAGSLASLDVIRDLIPRIDPSEHLGLLTTAVEIGDLPSLEILVDTLGRPLSVDEIRQLLRDVTATPDDAVEKTEYLLSLFPADYEPDLGTLIRDAEEDGNTELVEYLERLNI